MSRWPLVPLGEICVINPRLQPNERPDNELPVTFVPMAAVDEEDGKVAESRVRPYREVAKGYTAFRSGDVLFAKITPCMENGKAAVANGLSNNLGFGSTEFHVLRPTERVVADYVFYFIRRPDFRRLAKANFTGTAGQQRVPTTFIQHTRIPLPPLDDQRHIVDILNRANGIRRQRREALAKTRQLIPALFVDMFGDPATNPQGWPMVTVGELLSCCQYGTSQKASGDGSGVPIIRMGNVSYEGGLLLHDLKFVELDPHHLDKYRLHTGDILFNRTNSKELVGKTGLWDGRFEAVPASYFIRLRVDSDLSDPCYVWFFFNTSHMKRRLFEMARGAIGQSNINAKEVKALPIPLPPIAVQGAFTTRLSDIQGIITEQKRAAAAAEQLIQSLMARFFDG